jgi:hypothetical protein
MTRKAPARKKATPIKDRLNLLRKDPGVARWLKGQRAESTANMQLYQLQRFCAQVGKSPDELVVLAHHHLKDEGHELEDLTSSWVEERRKEQRSDSYLTTIWAAVRSWLRSQRADPNWSPRFDSRFGSRIVNEIVPTPQQLAAVLNLVASPGKRALVLILAQSGIRPGTLGAEHRPDGLRLKHLPELRLAPKIRFEKPAPPFLINVPAELSKNRRAYVTFATTECADELVRSLEVRAVGGEKLTPESALFIPQPKAPHSQARRAADGTPFLSEKSISQELRRMLRKVQPKGVLWRPYVLRSFCSSQLMVAENSQLISRDYREFIMGHSPDIARRYTLAKGKLRADLIEGVREKYAAASDQFLRILTPPEKVDKEAIEQVAYRTILLSAGLSKDAIDKLGHLTQETFLSAVESTRTVHETPSPKPGDRPRTVPNSELDAWLGVGWEPLSPAGAGRFIVKPPN